MNQFILNMIVLVRSCSSITFTHFKPRTAVAADGRAEARDRDSLALVDGSTIERFFLQISVGFLFSVVIDHASYFLLVHFQSGNVDIILQILDGTFQAN